MSGSFKIGDLVLAKMKGFPFWPGLITEPSKASQSIKVKPNHFLIYFFGSRNFSCIDLGNLKHYDPDEVDKKAATKATFKQALAEIEKYRKSKSPIHPLDELQLAASSPKPQATPSKRPSPMKKERSVIKKKRKSSIKDNLSEDYGKPIDINVNAPIDVSKNVSTEIPFPLMSYLSDSIRNRNIKNAGPYKIGIVGLGVIGSRIARNLQKTDHNIVYYLPDNGKKHDLLIQSGFVNICDDLRQLSKSADFILCCVSGKKAAQEILIGVLQGIRYKTAFVNLTNVDLETSKSFYNAVIARGGQYLECRAVGSRKDADDGDLIIFTAGSKEAHDNLSSVFNTISKKSHYLGDDISQPVILGCSFDLLNSTIMTSLAEVLSLMKKCGFNLETVDTVLKISGLSTDFLSERMLCADNENYTPPYSLTNLYNGISSAVSTSASCGVNLLFANYVKQVQLRALASQPRDMDPVSQFLGAKLP